MNETTKFLEKYNPEWLREHREKNKRWAKKFLIIALAVTSAAFGFAAGFGIYMGHKDGWGWYIYSGVFVVLYIFWVRWFIIGKVYYTVKTGDFN